MDGLTLLLVLTNITMVWISVIHADRRIVDLQVRVRDLENEKRRP